MLLAVTRLQAVWRARQPFRAYNSLRHAAIRTQVSWVLPLPCLSSLIAPHLPFFSDCSLVVYMTTKKLSQGSI